MSKVLIKKTSTKNSSNIFTNFVRELFSVGAIEKGNTYLIGPNQSYVIIALVQTDYFSQFASWKRNHEKYLFKEIKRFRIGTWLNCRKNSLHFKNSKQNRTRNSQKLTGSRLSLRPCIVDYRVPAEYCISFHALWPIS